MRLRRLLAVPAATTGQRSAITAGIARPPAASATRVASKLVTRRGG